MNPSRTLLKQQFKSLPHAPLVVLRSPSPQPSHTGRGSILEVAVHQRTPTLSLGSFITRLGHAIGLLAGALLLAGSSPASEAQFEEANRLYETGQFTEAASLYQAAGTKRVSANLLFNLGNAHYKAGERGRAMAAYNRSLRLDPRNAETQANLRFAREQANTQPPALTLRQRWLRNLSLGEWTALASAAITLLLLLLAARQLKPGAFEGNPSWIRLPALGALATGLLLTLAASDHFSDRRAFVIEAKSAVRNGPLEESPELFKATDGTELLVLDRKGDFLEVETSLGEKGWIHSGDVELLAP